MKYLILLLFPILSFAQIPVNDDDSVTYKFPPVRMEVDKQLPLPTCFVAEAESFALEMYEGVSISDLNNHCLTFYIETDSFTYAQHGSVEATQAWIDRIEYNAKMMFDSEGINIKFIESYIPITHEWSDNLNSTSAILSKFGEVRKVSPGHIKHFITLRTLGGGIAWVNMLCRMSPVGSTWGPFAVSAHMSKTFPDYPVYSWTVNVFCHETGHVLGSPHTQDCFWGPDGDLRVDDCVSGNCDTISPPERGTQMSYCHLTSYGVDFTKGFGELPGNLIRAAINAAACLEIGGPDKIFVSGNIEGTWVADTICLNNAVTVGPTIFKANVVEIEASDIFPVFETTKNNSCNE